MSWQIGLHFGLTGCYASYVSLVVMRFVQYLGRKIVISDRIPYQ